MKRVMKNKIKKALHRRKHIKALLKEHLSIIDKLRARAETVTPLLKGILGYPLSHHKPMA